VRNILLRFENKLMLGVIERPPAHAIYIDGILIRASDLVNGVTIVADAKPEVLSLTYFHIELDRHEAIIAEGLAVESYQRDNLYAFDNADEYVRLYGSPGAET